MFLLSGCAVGPRYTRPPAPAPPTYKETPPPWKTAQPSDQVARGKWWEIFHDRSNQCDGLCNPGGCFVRGRRIWTGAAHGGSRAFQRPGQRGRSGIGAAEHACRTRPRLLPDADAGRGRAIAAIECDLSLIHISEPTRLLSI